MSTRYQIIVDALLAYTQGDNPLPATTERVVELAHLIDRHLEMNDPTAEARFVMALSGLSWAVGFIAAQADDESWREQPPARTLSSLMNPTMVWPTQPS